MKLATWNVNSLKVRLPQVLDWLRENGPDVLCLQETKLLDENFPLAEINEAGYQAIFRGQKTYNGVAILSKREACDRTDGVPGFEDEQKRVLSATFGEVRVVSVYVPNGESLASEKFSYKRRWLDALHDWLAMELKRYPKLAVLGDYNIAPEDRDVFDPKVWEGSVLVSPDEREKFQKILALGFKDSFRLFEQKEGAYTWWDYRMGAFRRNMGLRIDHILLSHELAGKCSGCEIDVKPRRAERPSDHTPVVANVEI